MSWHIAIEEPRPFELLQPRHIDEALEWGARHGRDAAYLAGGCDLIEQLKHQWSTYHYVINLKRLPGLRGISMEAGSARVGALTTLGEIERDGGLRGSLPGLVQAAARVATPQIRNMGTVGGNLLQDSRCPYYRGPWYCYRAGGIVCDARHGIHAEHAIFGASRCYTVSPSDLAPMLVALDAQAIVRAANGERRIPVSGLFVLPEENIRVMHRLGPGEILAGVEIPLRVNQRSAFLKYAVRNSWDFAIASVAVALEREGDIVRNARIVLGAVAPVPWRSLPAEAAIEGKALTSVNIEDAAYAAVRAAHPIEQNEYKIPLVRKLVRTALTDLAA